MKQAKAFHWKNFSWQTLNYAVSGFLLLFLWVVMANEWSATEFGQFSALFAFVAVYGLVVDLGLDFYLTKRAAENSTKAFTLSLVQFKLLSSTVISILFLVLGWWLSYSFWALLWMLLGGVTLNVSLFFSCYLRGTNNLQLEAIISLIKNLCFAFGACWLLFGQHGIAELSAWYFFINICAAFATFTALRNVQFAVNRDENESILPHLRRSFGIWVVTLILGVSVRLDTLLLEQFSASSDVAVFSAASRWYEALFLVITAFVMAATPKLVQVFEQADKLVVRKEMQTHFQLLLLISFCAASLLVLIAYVAYEYLYAVHLQEGALIIYMLSVVFPIAALNYFLVHLLLLRNHAASVAKLMGFCVIINVIFAWFAIQWTLSNLNYSAGIGSALAYACKELVLLVGLWLIVVNVGIAPRASNLKA